MCGIFGVAGRPNTDGLREAALTLQHRGPDAFGEWEDSTARIYLAHCRLSIIDLSDAGRQPMANEDGTIQVTFNGEIYNFAELRTVLQSKGHSFRSRSDTEVIVHAYEEWGTACVERFRGIFAFGLWDGNRRRLVLARDHLGVKPLYYSICGDQLAFASEPRALLAIPGTSRALFIPAAIQFLQYTYTTGSTTIWDGVFRLPPAHVLEYDSNFATITRRNFWQVPAETDSWTLTDASERAGELLTDAVKEELVGDVPVGVFLSGGVDSSLVSAAAAKASPAINSFCVDFVDWDQSEASDAQHVAEHLGTRHHTCPVDRASFGFSAANGLTEFFQTWDEPLGDPAILPTWMISRMTREHVTVALSGDGGDELFAGYGWYQNVQADSRRKLAWFVEQLRRQAGIGRSWPEGCGDELEYYQLLHCPTFTNEELQDLFPDWTVDIKESSPGDVFKPWIHPLSEPVRKWQIVDLHSYLVDNNLTRVDRASMAHGLEVRVPLLDHRLVEFAYSLPDHVCCGEGEGKRVLRELVRRWLPTEVWNKPKQGFSFPMEQFVTQAEMVATLQTGCLVRHGLLNRGALHRLKQDSRSGTRPIKLWLLFVLEQWASIWLFQDDPSRGGDCRPAPAMIGAAL
ncbi:MAG: asparagine synthase (glutamine-hydrolyzing) [Planctomycetes bacterium]|nr:asparagine synthase (glutamine-hydrolyzing) [Planctomycetota bacterium]